MKRTLVGVMLVVAVAVMAIAWSGLRPTRAASSQLFWGESCSAAGADTTFAWQGSDPTAVVQWLDLSIFDNGWQPGTFISAGPLSPAVTSLTWPGLMPGTTHFVRINQMFPDGSWDPSPTFSLTTGCGAIAAAPASAPTSSGSAFSAPAPSSAPVPPVMMPPVAMPPVVMPPMLPGY